MDELMNGTVANAARTLANAFRSRAGDFTRGEAVQLASAAVPALIEEAQQEKRTAAVSWCPWPGPAPKAYSIIWIFEGEDRKVDLGYFDGFIFRKWTDSAACDVRFWAPLTYPDPPQ